METNEVIGGEGKKNKLSKRQLLANSLFWLYLGLLITLMVGAIVIAFTNHTGGWAMGVAVIAGLLAMFTVGGMVSESTDQVADRVGVIASLLVCVIFFMSSWFIPLNPHTLATKEREEGIVLYQGKSAYFSIPYTGRIRYLGNFTAQTEVSLLLNKEGKIKWEAQAELSLVADYDQSFALLRKFRGVLAWKNAVQQLFQQEVNRYVLEHVDPNQAVIPKSFSFSLDEQEQKEKFAKLGFSSGKVIVREISRVIYKEDQAQGG